jgi:hypothetical protein
MRWALDVWVPLVVFGPLMWLSNVGYWTSSAYRGALIAVALLWFGLLLWDPKRS